MEIHPIRNDDDHAAAAISETGNDAGEQAGIANLGLQFHLVSLTALDQIADLLFGVSHKRSAPYTSHAG